MSRIVKTFVAAALLACISTQANAGKPHVFIDYFSIGSSVDPAWAENVRSNVIEGILDLNRVNLTDVDSNSALKKEAERRMQDNTEAGDDMERMAVMTQQGANYLITGQVISLVPERASSGNYYTATGTFTLKIVNPKDGQTIDTKSFNLGTGMLDLTTGNTPEEAVMAVTKQAKKVIREFIEKNFKMVGTILEISESKNGEAKRCYIDLGSQDGLGDDSEFDVCLVKEIRGRRVETVIGSLKVKAVEGADIALCDVKKGGKEIQSAFDAEQEIVINSRPKKASLFDKVKSSTGL